jgi:ABC-type amino acid transport substrate-binding protein
MSNNKRITIIALVAVALLLVCGYSGCNNSRNATQTEDAYTRVLRDGKIRVGYISYPPSFMKDPNTGEMSGIFHEVLQEVGKNLELKIEYTEELGWGTMIEAVKSGRVDLVCTGIFPTSARGKSADFTIPLYYSTVRAYTAANNSRFDGNLSAIDNEDVRIAVIDGEMTAIIAKNDFLRAQAKSLSQSTDISQVLLEVATNKADVTFVEPAVAGEFIKNNPNKIKEVLDVKPLRVVPNVMMVGKGEERFLSTLNIAIQELVNNGFVDKVIQKYEKYPGSFQRIATPYKDSSDKK